MIAFLNTMSEDAIGIGAGDACLLLLVSKYTGP